MSDSTKGTGDPFALQPEVVDVPVTGENAGGQPQQATTWTMVRELLETVILSLIIFLLIRQVVQNYRIEKQSMEPNFQEGQFVLVNKLAYRLGQPDRGDVLVFHNPSNTNEDWIKRIIGLPGDTVQVQNATVFINGQPLVEDFPHNAISMGDYMPPIEVGENQLFVMGDNRPHSSDSRVIGPISQDLVVGQAWLRIWPLDKFGLVEHEELQ